MTQEYDCLVSIRNAKANGVKFTEWLATPMGQIGLELATDISALRDIYEECIPVRIH